MPMDNSTGKWTQGERELTTKEVFLELTDIQDKIDTLYGTISSIDSKLASLIEASTKDTKAKNKGNE